jgi:hypothetical protein
LEVFAAEIQNKIYTILGEEVVPPRKGKKAILVQAFHGLTSTNASFCHHLASCFAHLGFTLSKGHPDA